jgi:hypothetical protein
VDDKIESLSYSKTVTLVSDRTHNFWGETIFLGVSVVLLVSFRKAKL